MENPSQKPQDLNEWAYTHLKGKILNNEYTPGTQIKIEEISAQLNVSRTPIREALLRLKQDGLVEAIPRVGFYVTSVSKQDLKEVFEVRRIIECYAASRCVTLLTDDQIKDLFWHNNQCRLMISQGKLQEFNAHEVQLHDLIIGSLKNAQINRIRKSIEDLIYRQRVYSLQSQENLHCSVQEHDSIIKAIAKRDARNAEAAMNVHICNVEERLTQHLFDEISASISDRY